jgi:hypothetical protein
MITGMTFTDVAVVLSFLAIVMVVAKMLRALRLLEARVSLLQEQVEHNHGAVQKVVAKPPAPRPPGLRRDQAPPRLCRADRRRDRLGLAGTGAGTPEESHGARLSGS